jgi:hypothetical protein
MSKAARTFFEAQLSLDVATTAGRVIAHRDVRASSGNGTRGTFSTVLPIDSNAPKTLVLVVYAHSPKNGARIDVVRVPITLDARPAKRE